MRPGLLAGNTIAPPISHIAQISRSAGYFYDESGCDLAWHMKREIDGRKLRNKLAKSLSVLIFCILECDDAIISKALGNKGGIIL